MSSSAYDHWRSHYRPHLYIRRLIVIGALERILSFEVKMFNLVHEKQNTINRLKCFTQSLPTFLIETNDEGQLTITFLGSSELNSLPVVVPWQTSIDYRAALPESAPIDTLPVTYYSDKPVTNDTCLVIREAMDKPGSYYASVADNCLKIMNIAENLKEGLNANPMHYQSTLLC